MGTKIKTPSSHAGEPSLPEKIELVGTILASLDEHGPNTDQLWLMEAESRLAAYRRGEIKAIPLQEVLTKYREK